MIHDWQPVRVEGAKGLRAAALPSNLVEFRADSLMIEGDEFLNVSGIFCGRSAMRVTGRRPSESVPAPLKCQLPATLVEALGLFQQERA